MAERPRGARAIAPEDVARGAWTPALPAGLSQEWPAPWEPVWGDRDGAGAALAAWSSRGLASAVARLPDGLRTALAHALAAVAGRADRRHTRAAREFLRVAFPAAGADELALRTRRAWRHFMRLVLDAAAFERRVPLARRLEHCSVDWGPQGERARAIAAAGGSLVVTAHVGDFEAGAAFLPWLGFDPFYVVSRPPRNRKLSIAAQRLREARGVRVLHRHGALRHARAVLRGGGHLCLLVDQRARIKPVSAPFFGRPAPSDRSAVALARRLDAPLVVVACYREPQAFRYRMVFQRVIEPRELAGLTLEQGVALVNAEIERLIRRAPDQYFWLHERWRGSSGARALQPIADPAEE
jgi:KDO2-lipid IV(A) lauroyltransferase